jgi:hypothetical protein
MSQREQAEIVASWMYELDRLSPRILKSSIVPVTINLSYEDISFSLYGCAYTDIDDKESMYLLGKEPFEQLLQMTGAEDSGEFCLTFDKEYHVSGYMPKETYDSFDPELAEEYHPFGPNLMLGEADDEWIKSERKVIEMDVTYYPRLGSS